MEPTVTVDAGSFGQPDAAFDAAAVCAAMNSSRDDFYTPRWRSTNSSCEVLWLRLCVQNWLFGVVGL